MFDDSSEFQATFKSGLPVSSVTPSPQVSKKIVIKNVAEIEPEETIWLWENRIAIGKVTLFTGDPGVGKSQLTCYIAATVSKGGTWFDGSSAPQGKVLILSSEDDPASVISPRLIAAEADLTEIEIIDSVCNIDKNNTLVHGNFDVTKDLDCLATLLYELQNVTAIIIDPITAYLGKVDDNSNTQVRSVWANLTRMAEQSNVAIICVSHNNKSNNQRAMQRVMGSVAYTAASRAVYLVTKDNVDPDVRLFLPIKNNYGNDMTGLSFKIIPKLVKGSIESSCLEWLDEAVSVTADEVISSSLEPTDHSALGEAIELIQHCLAEGPQCASEILQQAAKEQISKKTLQRAKKQLGVLSMREGYGKGSKSLWKLP